MQATGVAIVGAGFGGIGMAIRLRQAGRDDFVLVEQSGGVGGAWHDNTYPGCACDIPSHLYSFSFAPHAGWTRRYPGQQEIAAYLQGCVDRFGLAPHIRLGWRLAQARRDGAAWSLESAGGDRIRARVLVLAAGMLSRPAIPPLPGIEAFRGKAFHSARWDRAAEAAGKRVVVIGTGASAVQLVPRLALSAALVTVLQRTPPWILPKRDRAYAAWEISALRHWPLCRRALRAWQYWSHESRAAGFAGRAGLLRGMERRARSHAKRQLAPGFDRALVTPQDRIGCRRILLSDDFLPSLNRANVRLVASPVARAEADSVVTADGASHPADVIVYATGFRADDPLGAVRVVGSGGVTLAEAWGEGMATRLGVAVAGFPNLFLLGGPNTGLGHNSVVFMLEAQIAHVLRCLRALGREDATLEVAAAAQARFVRRIDARSARSVWASGCRSWYLDRFGRNRVLWPGTSIGYWLRLRLLSARDYVRG